MWVYAERCDAAISRFEALPEDRTVYDHYRPSRWLGSTICFTCPASSGGDR